MFTVKLPSVVFQCDPEGDSSPWENALQKLALPITLDCDQMECQGVAAALRFNSKPLFD
jgi:hypothetical protein